MPRNILCNPVKITLQVLYRSGQMVKYSIVFSSYCIFALCVGILISLHDPALATSAHAASRLPTVTINREAASCLKGADWQCAIELLIPEYQSRGNSSGIQYYIAHAFRQLGRSAFKDNNLAEAQELFEQALYYDDTDPTLHAELGRIYLEQSQYDKAAHTFTRAFELDDENPRYAETLAQIYYLSGSIDDAIAFLETAITLKPDSPELSARLAQMKEKALSENKGTTQVSHIFHISFDDEIASKEFNTIWKILEDAWYRIGLELDFYPKRQIPVYLLSSENFRSVNGVPAWSGGIYEGRISVPLYEDQPEVTRENITHEYLHALLYDAMAYRCPWWLNEGLAQYLSLSEQKRLEVKLTAIRGHKKTAGWSSSPPELAALHNRLSKPEEVASSYGLALSATEYLIDRYTIVTLRAILHSMAAGKNFEAAFLENTSTTFEEFQDAWWSQL